ncbi:MAG: hypothetical protein AB1578_05275 [Thermodesulfobacteriota bacterium]
MSAVAGCVAKPAAESTGVGPRVRTGLLVAHSGLLLALLGHALGEGRGLRGQVLVPRFGIANTATLRDGTAVPLPFALEYPPEGDPNQGGVVVRRAGEDAGDTTPIRAGNTVWFSDGLRLYPAGEVRVGARGVLSIFDRDGTPLLDGLEVGEGDAVAVPGTGTQVLVTGLWESRNDLGPAVRLVVRDPLRGADSFLVYRALPGLDRARGGALFFRLTEFTPGCEYLRFWVVRDPGLAWAAAGGLLVFAGALAAVGGTRRVPRIVAYLRLTVDRIPPSLGASPIPPHASGRGSTTAGRALFDHPRANERSVPA